MSEPRFQVRIDVSIQSLDPYSSGGSLRISEDTTVDSSSLLELAGILGRFHDVIVELKAQREAEESKSQPQAEVKT